MRLKTILISIGTLALSSQAPADWQPIELDTFAHGRVLDGAVAGPATIKGVNFHHADSRLVAFDTRQRGTRDPDMEGPNGEDGDWTAGNVGAEDVLGTVLIVQAIDHAFAGYSDPAKTIVAQPDDEERDRDGVQPGAGEVTFKLDRQVSAFRFTLIDIEPTGAFEDRTGSYVVYSGGDQHVKIAFADLVDPSSAYYDASIRFGDHSANHFPAVSAEQLGLPWIDQVVINLGGSGAIGGLSYLEEPPADIGLAQAFKTAEGFGPHLFSGAHQGGSYPYGSPGGSPGGSGGPPGPGPRGPGDDPQTPSAVPTPGAGIAGALLISMLVMRRPRKD